MAKLIFFLGNPGSEYKKTRHNIPWIVCDLLYPSESWKNKFNSFFFKKDNNVIIKPQTYMNKSGNAAGQFLSFFNATPEDILVVHDDMGLKKGEVTFQKGGANRGHNGLRSVSQMLGTKDFSRIRIGIGHPDYDNISGYVLGKLSESEIEQMKKNQKIIEKMIYDFGG